MRIYFDDARNILGAFSDDDTSVQLPGAHVMYCPYNITEKVVKPYSFTVQQQDVSGRALFVAPDGSYTTDSVSRLANGTIVSNLPAVENVTFNRPVSIWDSPSEWTLQDVYPLKYNYLAAGRSYWFEEFATFDAIDFSSSRLSTGINSIAINSGDTVVFNPMAISDSVTLYVESGDNFASNPSIQAVATPANGSVVIQLSNIQQAGLPIAVHAVAVFY